MTPQERVATILRDLGRRWSVDQLRHMGWETPDLLAGFLESTGQCSMAEVQAAILEWNEKWPPNPDQLAVRARGTHARTQRELETAAGFTELRCGRTDLPPSELHDGQGWIHRRRATSPQRWNHDGEVITVEESRPCENCRPAMADQFQRRLSPPAAFTPEQRAERARREDYERRLNSLADVTERMPDRDRRSGSR